MDECAYEGVHSCHPDANCITAGDWYECECPPPKLGTGEGPDGCYGELKK